MQKNILRLTYRLLLAAVCILLPVQAIGQTWDGTADSSWPGTSLNLDNETRETAEISTPGQLAQLTVLVNSGKTFKGKTIKLTSDIDLDNREWTPIGKSTSTPFKGIFTGEKELPEEGCYTISNLTIDNDQNDYLGLFGVLMGKAIVESLNLVISDKGLTGKAMSAYVGGIAGLVSESSTAIYDCHITGGSITAQSTGYQSSHAGGIAGQLQGDGEIISCSASITITSEGTEPDAGGIVAVNDRSYIESCQYEGNIKTSSTNNSGETGGIAGRNNQGTVLFCHSAGNIESTLYAGGIIGQNNGPNTIIQYCYSTATVSATASGNGAGGIIGYNVKAGNTLQCCFATGDVTGEYAGGIVGYNSSSSIANCYATGKISGLYTGGIAGAHVKQSVTSSISYCYSTSEITGSSDYTGGIAALVYTGAIVDHCIALNTTCTQLGGRVGNSAGGSFSNSYASFLIPGEWQGVTIDNGDGADLTSQNFNDGLCASLSDWSGNNWDNLDSEHLPTLKSEIIIYGQSFKLEVEQPLVPRKPYLAFAVTYEEPKGGAITVQHANATDPDQIIKSGQGVAGLSNLIIDVTPANGFALVSMKVNGNDFVPGETLLVLEDVEIEATFRQLPPPYIPTYYTVTLPAVKGVTSKPRANSYTIEEGYNFTFYLTLDKGYEDSTPIVKANDKEIIPRASDGKYIIRNINETMNITIEGISNGDPTSIAEMEGKVKVQAVGPTLYIYLPKAETVYVHTISGLPYKEQELAAGYSQIQLTRGIYLVTIAGKTYKIVI